MEVQPAAIEDFESWIALALEVEPLFGPMIWDPSFRQGLVNAIREGRAFCIREDNAGPGAPLCGGIAVNFSDNEIDWFAVSSRCRCRGIRKALLAHVLALGGHIALVFY